MDIEKTPTNMTLQTRTHVLRQIIITGLILLLVSIIAVYIYIGIQAAKQNGIADSDIELTPVDSAEINRESILRELESATSSAGKEENERIIESLSETENSSINESERTSILEALAQ